MSDTMGVLLSFIPQLFATEVANGTVPALEKEKRLPLRIPSACPPPR